MNKNAFILPVSATFRDIKYPDELIKNAEGLEKQLRSKNIAVKIGKKVANEINSIQYEGVLDKQKVVISHTENIVPETPVEFLIMNESFDVDLKILKRLETAQYFQTPSMIHTLPKIKTYIAHDMQTQGFENLKKQFLKKKVSKKTALSVGRALAHLAQLSRTWEEFKTNESAQLSFYERSLEFLILYPEKLDLYRKLADEFSQFSDDRDKQDKLARNFVWPDCHPSNMMTDKKEGIVLMNFGRSYWGDQRYMLPSFLAHVMIYSLLGYLTKGKAVEYVKECVSGYDKLEKITNEAIFCQYLGLEVLHCSFGRKFDAIKTTKDKGITLKLGMSIFDNEIKSINTLLKTFSKIK